MPAEIQMTVLQLLTETIAHHRAGHLDLAAAGYHQLLAQNADHAAAQHGLGILEIECGAFDSGLAHLQKALELAPETGMYWQAFAEGLLLAGRVADALTVIQHAQANGLETAAAAELETRLVHMITPSLFTSSATQEPTATEIDTLFTLFEHSKDEATQQLAQTLTERYPNHPLGWKMLGAVLAQCQRSQEAVTALEKALQLKPDDAECLNTLGVAFEDLMQLDKALICYAFAAKCAPNFVAAFYNLARLSRQLGQSDDAKLYCHHALSLDAKHVKSYLVLGAILRDEQNVEEALNCYQKALALQPNNAEILSSLGNAQLAFSQLDAALMSQQRAAQIQPNHPEILSNLGNAFQRLGRLDESAALYQRALDLCGSERLTERKHIATHLLNVLLPSNDPEMLAMRGNTNRQFNRLNEAISDYKQAVAVNAPKKIYSSLLFSLNYHPDQSAEEIFSVYQEFNQRIAEPLQCNWQPHNNDRTPNRRLKIGYVSPDFRAHSTLYFLEPLLAGHDKTQVEVTAYAELTQEDIITERYRNYFEHWVPTRALTDVELAAQIRADQIDILIDLAGHTSNNRLSVFAYRPAPISISWLGYAYTTGLTAIDYFLTDEIMTPPGSEQLFSEMPWRIKTPAYVYRPATGMGAVSALPAQSNGYITFGTLTRAIRINHHTIRVWAMILQQVPNSRLVIDSKDFKSSTMQTDLIARFAAHDITAERLEIGYHSPPWDVLRGIDIGLDCFPHNSGTTLFEALYLGVPFITLAGRPSVGRLGSSILTGVGHPEWSADTEPAYIEKAVALAADFKQLAAIRATLRQELTASICCDEIGFSRRVEQAYRDMWQRWCHAQTAQ
jgi:protein O-GlcNAc transferase